MQDSRRLRPLLVLGGAAALAGYTILRSQREARFFAGKVAVITGGSRGLGLVLARQLRAEGCTVALLARDAEELASASAELDAQAASGAPGLLTVPCDLTRPVQVRSAVAKVLQIFGHIDILINSAGIIRVSPLAHLGMKDFQEAMALHFEGNLRMIEEVLPHLRQRGGGSIVNIASIGGRLAVPHLAAYTASKFALVGLSSALQVELAREGIRVTTVCPGLMRTGSHLNATFKGQHAREFDWFATSNNLPGSSVSAENAARQILNACRRGRAFLTFPITMRAAEIAQAVCPNIVARVSALINRYVLPAPGKDLEADETRSGWDSRSREVTPEWKTSLADAATGHNNEAAQTN